MTNTINYSFNIEVAKEYGVNESIFIANMQFWIMKNKANENNYHDGHYWTFNTRKALLKLFPFWSEQTLKTVTKHLIDKGVIIIGNYNKSPYDRTNWYAFADEELWICFNETNEKLESNYPLVKNNSPIPDINTNINTDIIKEKNNIKKESNDILESLNPEMKPIIEKWLQYKKERKEVYKPTGLKGCIDKLIKISNNDSFIAEQIVDESISNNWSGLFPLKKNNAPKKESVWEHNMKIMQEMEEENRNVEQNLF